MRALRAEPGSILIFLPGQGEIRRVETLLRERVTDPAVDIAPLYGALDRAEQDLAVGPAGRRKVVLATSIAETSLTIEGVRVVIDSGLARARLRAEYRPHAVGDRAGLARRRRPAPGPRGANRARHLLSSVGRGGHGRARGPMPGPRSCPPISRRFSSTAPPGALPTRRDWPSSTPAGPALKEARALLQQLHALDEAGRITETGRRLRNLLPPPRLAGWCS